MTDYVLTFARSARKELENLDRQITLRIFSKIEILCKNPRPTGCVKLHGGQGLWRIRVGDYRIVYAIDDKRRKIDISSIRHRKDVYRLNQTK